MRDTQAQEPHRRYGAFMDHSSLGDFLRSRRGLVSPASVGMPTGGVRRVPGLRREELAVLAGMSSDYYAKIEQGKEKHPTPQILDALARVLQLSEDERAYLYQLANLVPVSHNNRHRPEVSSELLQLMDAWPNTPAIVLTDTLDVLARNELATALYSGFDLDDNILRMTFLDPEGPRFYVDWQRAAEAAVANLRAAVGARIDSAEVAELVAELNAASPDFAELWSRQNVRGKTLEAKQFHHREVGAIALHYLAFDVRSAPGQQLVVYQAEPGTASSHALALLGTLAATRRREFGQA